MVSLKQIALKDILYYKINVKKYIINKIIMSSYIFIYSIKRLIPLLAGVIIVLLKKIR